MSKLIVEFYIRFMITSDMRIISHINFNDLMRYKVKRLEKNIFQKVRSIEKPIAIFRGLNNYEMRILKINQLPHKHHDHSIWFTVAKSDMTQGSWEYGDQYAKEILHTFQFIKGDEKFIEYFIEPYHANKLYPMGVKSKSDPIVINFMGERVEI